MNGPTGGNVRHEQQEQSKWILDVLAVGDTISVMLLSGEQRGLAGHLATVSV